MGKSFVPKNNILVTFLIPTRKRIDMLRHSLESIRSTCSNAANFEVIVIFDDDDLDTLAAFERLQFDFKIEIMVSKRFGYYGLHHYLNNAFAISSGKWLWLWNDDLRMIGSGWDLVVEEYGDKFLVLNPSNAHPYWKKYCKDATISPLVPREWFEVLGRLSAYNQYDTYVNSVAYPLNLVVNENRLINSHEQVVDEVSAGISYDTVPLPVEESMKDQAQLKKYLGKRRLLQYWLSRIPYRFSRYCRRRSLHFGRLLSPGYWRSRLTLRHILQKFKKFLNA